MLGEERKGEEMRGEERERKGDERKGEEEEKGREKKRREEGRKEREREERERPLSLQNPMMSHTNGRAEGQPVWHHPHTPLARLVHGSPRGPSDHRGKSLGERVMELHYRETRLPRSVCDCVV